MDARSGTIALGCSGIGGAARNGSLKSPRFCKANGTLLLNSHIICRIGAMFRFFRRRERSSLTLFEPGPQSVVVAEGADAPVAAEGTEVEPAAGEPEPEKLAVNESALVDPPQAPPEPEGVVAKSTPPIFAPADPAVPNLYSVRNAGVKFAIQDTTSHEPV